ncbi:unnamed protein product [Heterotrigona itama]|uniref:Uncharacterized protein n=1 Tax=Heterotrigona itama TaxID=395501 RepID=A0A6V7HMW3_9HYME|nr:unnamed protein product [Heterotrigona itama]
MAIRAVRAYRSESFQADIALAGMIHLDLQAAADAKVYRRLWRLIQGDNPPLKEEIGNLRKTDRDSAEMESKAGGIGSWKQTNRVTQVLTDHKDLGLDLSFSGHRARRKKKGPAIEEGCNKWLITLWMGSPSKSWEDTCYYFIAMLDFRIYSIQIALEFAIELQIVKYLDYSLQYPLELNEKFVKFIFTTNN